MKKVDRHNFRHNTKEEEIIINLLNSTPNLHPRVIIRFGNKSELRDIDLLVITSYPLNDIESFQIGIADIVFVSQENIERLLSLRDVIVLEPIINGTLLSGDQNYWKYLKKIALNANNNKEVQIHLVSQAMSLYCKAVWILYRSRKSKVDYVNILTNLSFSASYLAVARYYAIHHDCSPISVNNIMDEKCALVDIVRSSREVIQKANRGIIRITQKTVLNFIERINLWLLHADITKNCAQQSAPPDRYSATLHSGR